MFHICPPSDRDVTRRRKSRRESGDEGVGEGDTDGKERKRKGEKKSREISETGMVNIMEKCIYSTGKYSGR